MTVRTRIAPSPTGDPHVGTAYVALFNYCFAKAHGGQFLLRIEDTDQVRSTAESERMILEALRWTGLSWDEGPDIGGPHGPYRQSDRSAIYTAHAQILLEKGHAFRCFCTAEELTAMRKEATAAQRNPGYDGRCKHLSAEDVAERLERGDSFVIRMDVPREGTCVIDDMLRGEIRIEWSAVDMQVLIKSDGLPTYHMANVVDDHLMEITHVMRGEEWINSAPKHILLYRYFGWQAPRLCHLPLLRNPDKSKLSKRKNPTSILWYRRMGYLPEALLNYLGQMAWTFPDSREIFSLDEMAAAFTLDRISLGGPVFDLVKLESVNSKYIREVVSEERYLSALQQWAFNADFLTAVARLGRSRLNTFGDVGALLGFFVRGNLEVDVAALSTSAPKLGALGLRKALFGALLRVNTMPAWNREAIEAMMRGLADVLGVKPRDFFKPFYLAVTGAPSSVPLFDAMALLGRDLSRSRIKAALDALGAPTNAETKAWEAELKPASPAESDEG